MILPHIGVLCAIFPRSGAIVKILGQRRNSAVRLRYYDILFLSLNANRTIFAVFTSFISTLGYNGVYLNVIIKRLHTQPGEKWVRYDTFRGHGVE